MISVREVTPELHISEAVLFRCLFGVVFMVTWLIKVGETGLKDLSADPGNDSRFVRILFK